MHALLNDPVLLQHHIQRRTGDGLLKKTTLPKRLDDIKDASAVLFLLGYMPEDNGRPPELGLILNKRSQQVKQPGDLCCPGGGLSPRVDPFLAKAMRLPGLPMWRWPFWTKLLSRRPDEAKMLRVLFSTSLREGFEEMLLNPFGVRFLGPLTIQRLIMFQRVIYPMVGWVARQQRFRPNWEVEKIVWIPLRKLLDPGNYRQYRIDLSEAKNTGPAKRVYDAPSFLHVNSIETEVLWGATCRIVMDFLGLVFDFDIQRYTPLPILNGTMENAYLENGKRT